VGLAIVLGVVAVVAVIALAVMAFFGIGLFNRATADFRGKNEAIEKTKADGEFRIASYNEFFDLCGAIQASEDRIAIFEERLDTEQDPSLRSEAQTNLDAVRAQRASDIREYNAKASRDFTEGQFRDRDLPYRIDINQEDTQCKL
jgi:hypothetical protein